MERHHPHPQAIPEVIRKAFKMAESEKPGATHIEFAEDIAAMPVLGKALAVKRVRRPDPDNQALDAAVALLKRTKYPLIIAGNGAVRKAASEELTLLARKHCIPVVHTFMGQGAISDRDPQSLFTIVLVSVTL